MNEALRAHLIIYFSFECGSEMFLALEMRSLLDESLESPKATLNRCETQDTVQQEQKDIHATARHILIVTDVCTYQAAIRYAYCYSLAGKYLAPPYTLFRIWVARGPQIEQAERESDIIMAEFTTYDVGPSDMYSPSPQPFPLHSKLQISIPLSKTPHAILNSHHSQSCRS